jgi:hypothetical protein
MSRVFATMTAVLITGALSLVSAGQAVARPDADAGRPRQVNGVTLQAGLLPASVFGDSFSIKASLNTGRNLHSTRITDRVSRLSCGAFEETQIVSGLGNSAGAVDEYDNSQWLSQYPDTVIFGYQVVLQFPSSGAANSFFGQARAKYASCGSFSAPDPSDQVIGGGQLLVDLQSLTSTSAGGYRAFAVIETVAFSQKPGMTFYNDVLYAVAGTNVYYLSQINGMNDTPTQMAALIHREQRQYARR